MRLLIVLKCTSATRPFPLSEALQSTTSSRYAQNLSRRNSLVADPDLWPLTFHLSPCFALLPLQKATISYGEDLNADQLMVQYGFPVPTTVPLARPLGDTDVVQNRASATAKAEMDSGEGSVANKAAPGEGMEMAAAEGGGGEEWGEVARRSLMDKMFMLGQQRFAREAGSDNLKFETLVSLLSCLPFEKAVVCVHVLFVARLFSVVATIYSVPSGSRR